MQPPDPRPTLAEALLAFLASATGVLSIAPVLYALLGVWAMPIVQLLLVAGPALIVCLGRGRLISTPPLIGLHMPTAAALAGALLVGASFWFLELRFLEPIARRWLEGREVGEMLQRTLLPDDVPLGLVIALVSLFPGVCEELLFRGVLLRAFQPRLGAAGAVVLSGVLFALFHVHPAHMLPNLAFGLLLGTTVLLTGSLVTSMVIHAVHNAVVLSFAGEVWPGVAEQMDAHPTAAVMVAAVASVAGLSLMWAGRGSGRDPSAAGGNQGSS